MKNAMCVGVVALGVMVGMAIPAMIRAQIHEPTDRRDSHPYTVRINGENVRTMGLPDTSSPGEIRVRMACDAYRQTNREIGFVIFDAYDVESVYWIEDDSGAVIGIGTGFDGVTLRQIAAEDDGDAYAVLRFTIGPKTLAVRTEYRTAS